MPAVDVTQKAPLGLGGVSLEEHRGVLLRSQLLWCLVDGSRGGFSILHVGRAGGVGWRKGRWGASEGGGGVTKATTEHLSTAGPC
jgi:hypothetical protein